MELLEDSVVDPDPGSGAFLTPGSGKFLTLDPGWKNSDPRSGILQH